MRLHRGDPAKMFLGLIGLNIVGMMKYIDDFIRTQLSD